MLFAPLGRQGRRGVRPLANKSAMRGGRAWGAHLAMLCKSSSVARCGAAAPPLRSAAKPGGLPKLGPEDQEGRDGALLNNSLKIMRVAKSFWLPFAPSFQPLLQRSLEFAVDNIWFDICAFEAQQHGARNACQALNKFVKTFACAPGDWQSLPFRMLMYKFAGSAVCRRPL